MSRGAELNKSNFTVIRGGLLDSVTTSRKEFVSAYITNTRLMGVLGMYVHFSLPDNGVMKDIHQFFYFDIEEFGFESYHRVKDGNLLQVKEIENSLIGGLGGEEIPITLKEVKYVLQKYARYNRKHGLPLPEGREEYDFLLKEEVFLNEKEREALIKKQCVEIDSKYEVVNYFVMRCVGKDFEGAALLAEEGVKTDLFPDFAAGTFCKNNVEKGSQPNTYISESLIEIANSYYLMVTSVTLDEHLTVTDYRKISSFRISPTEAAMMLGRPEFVSVYQLPEGSEPFSKSATKLTRRAMLTDHETGDLYMIFHPNNKHVAKKEYRLNEDILGIYFVTPKGQLIATAYSLAEIRILEYDLMTSNAYEDIRPVSTYEFCEPVLYEFVQSGFEDFEEFIDLIKVED